MLREFIIYETKGLCPIKEVWRGEGRNEKEALAMLDKFGYGHTLVEVLERK